MTANEMKRRVAVEADRQISSGAAGYEAQDFSDFLTKSQWYYVFQTLDWKNNKKREGFEETEIRKQGLSALIKDGEDLSNSQTPQLSPYQAGRLSDTIPGLEGKFFDLPDDFMLSIMESAVTDQTDPCSSDSSDFIVADVKVVGHDEVKKWKGNPYKKPYVEDSNAKVWRLTYKRPVSGNSSPNNPLPTPKRHELITDGTFDVTDYKLRYLKIPEPIVVDEDTPSNQRHCELDEFAQESIIEIAVGLIKEAAERKDIKNLEPINNLE